jgi:hypothetical protein
MPLPGIIVGGILVAYVAAVALRRRRNEGLRSTAAFLSEHPEASQGQLDELGEGNKAELSPEAMFEASKRWTGR